MSKPVDVLRVMDRVSDIRVSMEKIKDAASASTSNMAFVETRLVIQDESEKISDYLDDILVQVRHS